MNLRRFMRHRVSWEKAKEGGDDFTGREYEPAVEIPARKKQVARQVQGGFAGGAETRNVDEITVMSEHDVKIGDKLDGEIVQARQSLNDVNDRINGYKLYYEPVQRS